MIPTKLSTAQCRAVKFEEQQSGSWQQTIEQLAETLYPKLGPKRGSATENLYRSALLVCPRDHPYITSARFFKFFLTHPPYVSINSADLQQNLPFF